MEKIIKPAAWSDVDMSNPCDLSNLRLSQSDAVGVKKLLTTVRVHKPEKQDFIRVHPDEKYRVDIPMILLKDDREFYAIGRNMVSELASEATAYTLFTTVNRQGVLFLWPIRLPDADGKDNEWYRSAREAAGIAVGGWCRVQSNRALGAYEIYKAQCTIPEPEWPEASFQELVNLAFRERVIDTTSHPVVKRLRGLE